MEIILSDLIGIQEEVDQKIIEKIKRIPKNEEKVLAFNVELFEFFNAVGVWKWWKHNHELNKERILDELADCFAFYLSLLLNIEKEENNSRENLMKEIDKELNQIYTLLFEYSNSREKEEVINNLIKFVGTDNEAENSTSTTYRFVLAIFIVELLFESITWKEITEAYRKKSAINIARQNNNY